MHGNILPYLSVHRVQYAQLHTDCSATLYLVNYRRCERSLAISPSIWCTEYHTRSLHSIGPFSQALKVILHRRILGVLEVCGPPCQPACLCSAVMHCNRSSSAATYAWPPSSFSLASIMFLLPSLPPFQPFTNTSLTSTIAHMCTAFSSTFWVHFFWKLKSTSPAFVSHRFESTSASKNLCKLLSKDVFDFFKSILLYS